jgi:hypothetical protein
MIENLLSPLGTFVPHHTPHYSAVQISTALSQTFSSIIPENHEKTGVTTVCFRAITFDFAYSQIMAEWNIAYFPFPHAGRGIKRCVFGRALRAQKHIKISSLPRAKRRPA